MPQLSGTAIRAVIETPVLLFVPGYSLVAALFPGKTDISGLERVGFSFGLSIAVVPLTAYFLNFTQWALTVLSIVTGIFLVVIATVLIAYARRHALPRQERFSFDFGTVLTLARGLRLSNYNRLQRGLLVILGLSILFSASALGYSLVTPAPRESYTEFYLLGPTGKMQGYPANLTVGQAQSAVVGIVNHENRDVTYTLIVSLNDTQNSTTLLSGRQMVGNGQTSEKAISLTPNRSGNNERLDFLLTVTTV